MVLLLCALPATSLHAATAVCVGKVLAIANHTPGGLFLQIEGATLVKVCDFDANQFSVTPNNCRHLASLASMAYAMDKQIQIYIDNAPSTVCSAIPPWHTSDTRYFHLYP